MIFPLTVLLAEGQLSLSKTTTECTFDIGVLIEACSVDAEGSGSHMEIIKWTLKSDSQLDQEARTPLSFCC